MATETVVSEHTVVLPEEVEKEVQSEVKKLENTRQEESPCPAAPSAEPEAKVEEKQIEPHVTEEVKGTTTDEKPKAEDSTEDVAPLAESTEQKIEDKPVEVPPTEKQKQTEDVIIVEASDKEIQQVAKETVPEPDTTKTDEKQETGPASKEEESKVESVEEKEEPPKIDDVTAPLSSDVVTEKVENAEDLPLKVEAPTEVKDAKVTEGECKREETSEAVPVVQSEVNEKTQEVLPVVEPVEKVEAETPTDKAEDTNLSKEEDVISDVPETKVEEKHVDSSVVGDVSVKINEAIEQQKPVNETVKVDASLEGKVAESEKVEAGTVQEAKIEEENVATEEKAIEGATSSVPAPEVAEKAAEVEVSSRDIELAAENGDKKDETLASTETTKEGKVDEETTEPEKTYAGEKIEESVQATEPKLDEDEKKVDRKIEETVKETEAKLEEEKPVGEKIEETVKNAVVEEAKQVVQKTEETTQATEPKLEGEKQVDEPVETDVQIPEVAKESEDSKPSLDTPKEDVPVKKPSLVKMMKQSLVKAKKAITGKSQNSKTQAPEAKEDVSK